MEKIVECSDSGFSSVKCPTVSDMLSRLGDKWTVLVIMMLRSGPKRFGVLKRSVVGISQRMLTLTLRALERDGLVSRTVYPTTPPAVEYALTELGQSFAEPIVGLGSWVFEHHDRIHAARAAFDARKAQEDKAKEPNRR